MGTGTWRHRDGPSIGQQDAKALCCRGQAYAWHNLRLQHSPSHSKPPIWVTLETDLSLESIKIKTKTIKMLRAEGVRVGGMIIVTVSGKYRFNLLYTRPCTKTLTSITLLRDLSCSSSLKRENGGLPRPGGTYLKTKAWKGWSQDFRALFSDIRSFCTKEQSRAILTLVSVVVKFPET